MSHSVIVSHIKVTCDLLLLYICKCKDEGITDVTKHEGNPHFHITQVMICFKEIRRIWNRRLKMKGRLKAKQSVLLICYPIALKAISG